MPQTSRVGQDDPTTCEQERRRQAEALYHLCRYHPGRLTMAELDTAMSEGDGRKLVDDTEIAVRELVRHGLAHREGDFVFPTRAAAHAPGAAAARRRSALRSTMGPRCGGRSIVIRRLRACFVCPIAAAALVIAATGCGLDGETAATTGSAAIDRQLRLPHVDREQGGRKCPLSLALGASLLPGRPSAEAALGPGLGTRSGLVRLRRGPVYVMFPGIPRVPTWRPTAADRRLGEGWGSSPALVLTRAAYRGPVVLRGDRIDGRGTLRIGAGQHPATRLELPAGDWRDQPRLRRWGIESGPDGRWRAWATTLRFHLAGCYGIQVDGRTFSYPLVFEPDRLRPP